MRKLGKRPEQFFPFIATPAYDGRIYTDYTLSLADTMTTCAHADKLGLTQFPIKCHVGIMGNGAFIEIARNTFVQMFIESKCTHLFFIDGDLKWEPRAFVGIVTANKPIACGMYRRRQEPENYPVMLALKDESLWMEDGGWVQCRRVPTGFLCIRRDVILEMVEAARHKKYGMRIMKQPSSDEHPELPWLFGTKFDDEDRYMGEDFSFCDSYVEMYEQFIPAWADFDFVHAGYKCNWLNFLNSPEMADGHILKRGHDNSGVMKVEETETFKEVPEDAA